MTTRSDSTRRFYNANTGLFLRFGHSSQGSIHRAVWGEGVRDRDTALHYVDELICEQIQALGLNQAAQVVDLGCGVGASLSYVASKTPIRGLGVTISEKQQQLAQQRFDTDQQADKLNCLLADFCQLPDKLPEADLVFAIESFVHAPDAQAFFREAARLMKPGAKLIICDDFLNQAADTSDPSTQDWLNRFQQGWLVNSLLSPPQADAIARDYHLRLLEQRDLSPHLELGRPRDKFIAFLLALIGKLALKNQYLRMLNGGHALQHCLQSRILNYYFLVWEKTDA